jgi:hypothetical protein
VKIIYMSDDGKFHAEAGVAGLDAVRAYEEKQRDPLAKMHFPYYCSPGSGIMHEYEPGYGTITDLEEKYVVVAFANLAPLIQETLKAAENSWPATWRSMEVSFTGIGSSWSFAQLQKLLLAYEEALELAKKL